jgi:hypothetical protein
MSKKQMTAKETLDKVRDILEYYMTEDTGYSSLLSISRGEWGMFNNDWEAEAFYTCQELIELLGLAEPHESEEEEEGEEEVYIEDEE